MLGLTPDPAAKRLIPGRVPLISPLTMASHRQSVNGSHTARSMKCHMPATIALWEVVDSKKFFDGTQGISHMAVGILRPAGHGRPKTPLPVLLVTKLFTRRTQAQLSSSKTP